MTMAQALEATAAQERADRLALSARNHKRAAAFHRRAAQRARQELARYQAECARLGIHLEVTGQGATD